MDVSWEEFGWERLGNGTGRRRLPVWDATVALVAGADGVLLYDTGSTLREGVELRTQAEALLGRRVTHIALSHPHFDHVLGTAAFSGAEVYGAVGTADLLARGAEELRADALLSPRHQVTGEWTLDLGDGFQVLLANVGPGHSGHDLAVLVPGSPVVVLCGDLVEESGEPQAGRDAVPTHWPAALDRLLELGGEDAPFVRAQRDRLAVRFGVS